MQNVLPQAWGFNHIFNNNLYFIKKNYIINKIAAVLNLKLINQSFSIDNIGMTVNTININIIKKKYSRENY